MGTVNRKEVSDGQEERHQEGRQRQADVLIAPIYDEQRFVQQTWSRCVRSFAEDTSGRHLFVGTTWHRAHALFVDETLRSVDTTVLIAREPKHNATIGWVACEPGAIHFVHIERAWTREGFGTALVRAAIERVGPRWRPTHLTAVGQCFLRHLAAVGLAPRATAPSQDRHGKRPPQHTAP